MDSWGPGHSVRLRQCVPSPLNSTAIAGVDDGATGLAPPRL